MSIIQIILIAIFVYLGSIGSIVGNTIGWYTLGRPLVAALVVGSHFRGYSDCHGRRDSVTDHVYGQRHAGRRGCLGLIVCHLHRCRRSDRLRSGDGRYRSDRSGRGLRRNRRTGRSGHVEFVVCLKPAAEPGCRKNMRKPGIPAK